MIQYSEYDSMDLFDGCWTNSRLTRNVQPLICPEMNIQLEPKIVIPGYGLYGITFNFEGIGHRLIYIGKFQGAKEKGRFGGNIVTERWRRHLYTISMRGHRVGCAYSRLHLFNEMILGLDGESPFLASLTEEQVSNLTPKAGVGCQTSLNRLLFSYVTRSQLLKYTHSEEADIAQVCGSFRFHYWQVIESQSVKIMSPKPKVDLKAVEDHFIRNYSEYLPVNDEYKWTREKVKNFDPGNFIELGSAEFAKLSSDIQLKLDVFEGSQN